MLFNTLEFAIFFAIVCGLYFFLKRRAQNAMLLAASYIFYGWWDWRFLSLLIVSTIMDYTTSYHMEGASQRKRRVLLLISMTGNLGMLGFFKYCDFFITSAARALDVLGVPHSVHTLGILLPVGISFYTFQTMSYVIDVYRGHLKPCRSLLDFSLFVTYFPQLVAGPIERATHLLPEIQKDRRVTWPMVRSGAVLVLIGLVRKLAIADFVAPTVVKVFDDPAGHGWQALAAGVLLFALQLYGDFAGYSDIARGTSRILGIELMVNFNQPYFSTDITDYWRRWHISLSTWLRDYLYIPLGGSRGSRLFHYRNLMLTMVLGGLWHGAAWTYVAWGTIHGLALVVHKMFLGRFGEAREGWRIALPWTIACWAMTMGVSGLSYIFFSTLR